MLRGRDAALEPRTTAWARCGRTNRRSPLPCAIAAASVAGGLSVLAALGGAVVDAGRRIAGDGLVATVGTIGEGHAMALAHQRAHGLPGEPGLQVDLATIAHRRGSAGRLGRTLVLDARCVAGLLQVHAEVHQ